MKCDTCGTWTEVLETRQVDGGHTLKRTRRCGNGHRFPTFEVLELWASYLEMAAMAAKYGPSEAARQLGVHRTSVLRAIRAVRPKSPR